MNNLRSSLLHTTARLRHFWRDEGGATAVEYGLFVAAIAAVIVAIVVALGDKINAAFTNVNSKLP